MAKTLNTALSHSIQLDIPGEEYSLTRFEEWDIEAMREILAIEAVSERLLRIPNPYTLDDAKDWASHILAAKRQLVPIPTIKERKIALFAQSAPIPMSAIRHKDTFIGAITLSPRAGESALELGYYLNPSHHGKRIMREAGRKLLRYAANEWGIRSVYSSADLGNPASAHVIGGIVQDTAVGEVEKGKKILVWPQGKKVEGESESDYWVWSIEADEGYEA